MLIGNVTWHWSLRNGHCSKMSRANTLSTVNNNSHSFGRAPSGGNNNGGDTLGC